MPQKKKLPFVTVGFVAVNVLVYMILEILGNTENSEFMVRMGAVWPPYVKQGEYWRLFTATFMHFGFEHLVNNIVMLLVIGFTLEREIGTIKFLIIYLLSGLGGNLLSAVWDMMSGSFAVSAGASGAIFGIVGALLYVAIRNRGRVGDVSGRGLAFMVILSLYYGFTSGGVDNFAHIGGLLSGFILSVLLYWKRQRKYSGYAGN